MLRVPCMSSPFEAGFAALFTTMIVFGTLGESLARLGAGEGEGESSLCRFLPAVGKLIDQILIACAKVPGVRNRFYASETHL